MHILMLSMEFIYEVAIGLAESVRVRARVRVGCPFKCMHFLPDQ